MADWFEAISKGLVRPHRIRRDPTKMVAIVVPASSRPVLTPDEETSLRHLRRFLAPYDKFLLVPRGSGCRLAGLHPIELSRRYFGSARAHGRLLIRRDFYGLFETYKYILIYHLDALVFRDELPRWCETNVDYIGAPWLPGPDTPWVTEPGVGNGGFTLMKVQSVLNVLHNRYRVDPSSYWEDTFGGVLQFVKSALQRPRQMAPKWLRGSLTSELRQNLKKVDRVVGRIDSTARRNDLFWSRSACRYQPDFQIPDWRTALRFAFEAGPRMCFELNEHRLPFGCHAWARYDRDFWTPHLLP